MERTAVVIDDDENVHKYMRSWLVRVPELESLKCYFSADEAYADITETGEVIGVIFCDIMMPGKDGFEAHELLEGWSRLFIFLTDVTKLGEEVFNNRTMVHFMRKPPNSDRVSKLISNYETRNETMQPIKGTKLLLANRRTGERVAVDVSDILRIELAEHYGEATVRGMDETLQIHGSLVQIMKQLEKFEIFVQVNQNLIISLDTIGVLKKNLVVLLKDGNTVNVTRTYRPKFKEFAKKHGLG